MNKRKVVSAIAIAAFLLALLALGTTFILPRVSPASDEVKRSIAKGDIASLTVALKLYRLHTDDYPATEQGLKALVGGSGITNWRGPYIERQAIDPWKTPYQYSRHSSGFTVSSAGPDRSIETDDDITN